MHLGRDCQNGGYKIWDVEAINPKIRTVTDIDRNSFDGLIEFEPTGVRDRNIRLTSEDVPLQTEWHYPPVCAVADTKCLPDEPGKC